MDYKVIDQLYGLFKTIGLLFVLNIFSTAFIPALGFEEMKLSFNILIVLYLALKVDSHLKAYFILFIQYFHSAFTIEGWAIGTFIGLFSTITVRFLKDLLDFSSWPMTLLIVSVYQLFWISAQSLYFALKIDSSSGFWTYFSEQFPEYFFLCALAPLMFKVLDLFWSSSSSERKLGNI